MKQWIMHRTKSANLWMENWFQTWKQQRYMDYCSKSHNYRHYSVLKVLNHMLEFWQSPQEDITPTILYMSFSIQRCYRMNDINVWICQENTYLIYLIKTCFTAKGDVTTSPKTCHGCLIVFEICQKISAANWFLQHPKKEKSDASQPSINLRCQF
jgi:hypothetical protein